MKTSAVAKALKASAGSMELGGLLVRTYRRANSYIDADISAAPEALKLQA